MTEDLARIWQQIQDELRRAVPASTYEIWLAPLRAAELEGDELVVDVPRAARGWVAERFARVLQSCVAAVLGPQTTVELRAADTPAAARPTPADAGIADPDEGGDRLNPKFTFDQFVIGPANRFAHAAALAVAELPGQAYNPLFVYGPPGVGKTHLLHSIGNYVRAYGGGLTVRYTTVETFTNQFVRALQSGAVDRFKGLYRRADVLLIDDVQFLASKARTEEEFFHTFNALQDMGSQLVLTCDRVPRDLDGLQDRLRERFEAGLVTDIRPPDLATRMTVLRKRIAHDEVRLADPAVLELIAERVTANVRALEGALIRVVAFASLTGRPLDAALATEVLDGLYPDTAPARPGQAPQSAAGPAALTVERIQDVTARAFGLERGDLLSSSRAGRVAWARQLAMYLVREHTDATLPAIGRSFGGRNHTTVLHACRRAAARLAGDP
ncbi:MAG TPA: chromosomal replication initiator protein DnaA, partial [Solirubrobacteraceae bacterium]|nr:chromosomal replication initiator protein DnaA [Solirubrobacteraceae bacterium]